MSGVEDFELGVRIAMELIICAYLGWRLGDELQ